jgi:hypothetical protein
MVFMPMDGYRSWAAEFVASSDEAYTTWFRLDRIDASIYRLGKQLYSVRLASRVPYEERPSFVTPELFHEYWVARYRHLSGQAYERGIHRSRLACAARLARRYVMQACQVLEAELLKKISAPLRRGLRYLKSLKARILQFATVVYEFRNQITLQRRYYLAHGSHPSDSTSQKGWLGLDFRGCVPTFLQ